MVLVKKVKRNCVREKIAKKRMTLKKRKYQDAVVEGVVEPSTVLI